MKYEIVIATSGRASLAAVLDAIGPEAVIVVDDRRDRARPLGVAARVMAGPARGPAAARNAGWRAARAEWVAFLDDDVVPEPGWRARLEADLDLPADVAGTQGRIVVPVGPRPTDWERNVAGLEHARWATADMAYRRAVVAAVGGFDERFPRAYREDADLGLRVTATGRRIVTGARRVVHPVRPAPTSISVTKQAGNADDVLMRRLHGRDWRERAGVPRGRRPRHLATTAAALGALATAAWPHARRAVTARASRAPAARAARSRAARAALPSAARAPRRLAARAPRPFAARATRPHRALSRRPPRVSLLLAAAWLAGTAELAWARIAPGPRTPREVATMLWTSVVIPFAATAWWLRGLAGAPGRGPRPQPAAVLFDRDGTLIADVPYNGDPARAVPMPGAPAALARLRAAGVALGVVSNQSGIARGLLDHRDVAAVHARMEALLGPLGPLEYCPHGPHDGCACRKPAPGLIVRAAERLGVEPRECVVIGDIGSDVDAAIAAGARPVLVPTPRTRRDEIAAAPERAADLAEAVDLLLGAARPDRNLEVAA